MHRRVVTPRHRWLFMIVPVILVSVLALTACGTNGTTTGSAPTGTTPTSTVAATSTPGQASKDGCPNSSVVTTAPPAANVVLTSTNSGTTVNAKKGDIVQVNLPFGHTWLGPLAPAQTLLTAQGPAGYAYPTAKSCVWRFLAASTGMAHLSFSGKPICQKGQACPMYVMEVILTVDIK